MQNYSFVILIFCLTRSWGRRDRIFAPLFLDTCRFHPQFGCPACAADEMLPECLDNSVMEFAGLAIELNLIVSVEAAYSFLVWTKTAKSSSFCASSENTKKEKIMQWRRAKRR